MVEVVTPMWTPDQPVGLLALGRRWDEEIFDPRDLEITELVAQQALEQTIERTFGWRVEIPEHGQRVEVAL